MNPPFIIMKHTPISNRILNRKVIMAAFILFLFTAFFIQIAYCESDYDLTDLDDAVAETLGIDSFTAGLLISAVILTFVTVMVGFSMYKAKSNVALYGIIITDFVTMAFLVGLGWLPYYIFLVIALLIAVLFAGQIRDLITGGGD